MKTGEMYPATSASTPDKHIRTRRQTLWQPSRLIGMQQHMIRHCRKPKLYTPHGRVHAMQRSRTSSPSGKVRGSGHLPADLLYKREPVPAELRNTLECRSPVLRPQLVRPEQTLPIELRAIGIGRSLSIIDRTLPKRRLPHANSGVCQSPKTQGQKVAERRCTFKLTQGSSSE